MPESNTANKTMVSMELPVVVRRWFVRATWIVLAWKSVETMKSGSFVKEA